MHITLIAQFSMFEASALHSSLCKWRDVNAKHLQIACYMLIFVFLNLVLIFALTHDFNKAIPLLVILAICWLILLLRAVGHIIPQSFQHGFARLLQKVNSGRVRYIVSASTGIALSAYVLYLCILNTVQLISLAGLLLLIVISLLLSNDPAKVSPSKHCNSFIFQLNSTLLSLCEFFAVTIMRSLHICTVIQVYVSVSLVPSQDGGPSFCNPSTAA